VIIDWFSVLTLGLIPLRWNIIVVFGTM